MRTRPWGTSCAVSFYGSPDHRQGERFRPHRKEQLRVLPGLRVSGTIVRLQSTPYLCPDYAHRPPGKDLRRADHALQPALPHVSEIRRGQLYHRRRHGPGPVRAIAAVAGHRAHARAQRPGRAAAAPGTGDHGRPGTNSPARGRHHRLSIKRPAPRPGPRRAAARSGPGHRLPVRGRPGRVRRGRG